jgi:triosephosphate isomerase (TIM)
VSNRLPIVGGNWKLNSNRAHARELLHALRAALDGINDVQVVICPPALWLGDAADTFEGGTLGIGAQNVYWEPSGAYTGEQSAEMLVGTVSHVLIGHSERRSVFGETVQDTNRKLRSVLAAGLTPILAIGEQLEQREAGETNAVLERQLLAAFEGIDSLPADAVVAYEPVWAIGSGLAATPEIAQEAAAATRAVVEARYGSETAAALRIQYGGSVNAENAGDFVALPDIDGALVGGASLRADEFAAICGAFAHGYRVATGAAS